MVYWYYYNFLIGKVQGMKTQTIVFILLSTLCVGVLLFSASAWKQKISEAGGEILSQEEPLAGERQTALNISPDDILRLGASLDDKTLEVLLSRQKAGETVQMLVIGSEAMTTVGEMFAKAIREDYADFIETDVATFDMTSARFVEEGLESEAIDWAKGYDIVLYEPFTWKNNGNVVIEQEHQHLLAVMELAKSHVADASFIVTPPQPIYKAGYYLTQIRALERLTTTHDIPYIEHWANWPDTQSAELLDYLDEDLNPSAAGVEAWSNALIRTFTGE